MDLSIPNQTSVECIDFNLFELSTLRFLKSFAQNQHHYYLCIIIITDIYDSSLFDSRFDSRVMQRCIFLFVECNVYIICIFLPGSYSL